MLQLTEKIEMFLGRKVDFPNEVDVYVDHTKIPVIRRWEVEGIPQPTAEELDAFADKKSEYDVLNYKSLRMGHYPDIEDQLDMQYWDLVNGTTIWKDYITKVKSDIPK